MSDKINILFTGATGYIGGAVLERLLKHPDASRFHIIAIVRSQEKAEKLKKLGIDVVVGSHSDAHTVRDAASKADVVFAVADADNLDAASAMMQGLKQRFEKTGKKSVLIHTSGTGTLTDKANGAFTYDKVYDDNDADQIETLSDDADHRHVDLLVLKADKDGYVKTHIVLPSTIYGIYSGKLVDLGIQNPHSVQIPKLIKLGKERGQAGMCGKGQNTWPHVHINDIADLYINLYDAIVANSPAPGHGREGYYFGENGHYRAGELAKAIAVELAAHGVGKDEPTTFTEEEFNKDPMVGYFGTNSRAKGSRARALGWKPKYTDKDFYASIKPEVNALLK
ncbi:NAD(P)-binding protein [Pterulicium gracile]|uniref:NAD(P)-binding protein n=1 Tax=Pterulicium gracile TaxID=1884261 RepID=A0A5C3QED1_9AGAR|nr:NAD(P)-binding protein [Pterula gracilis]